MWYIESHHEFRLRNGNGKDGCGKMICLSTLSFWASSQIALPMQLIRLLLMVHVSLALKKTIPPLIWLSKRDQNIVFLETSFASNISEPEITVWNVSLSNTDQFILELCFLQFAKVINYLSKKLGFILSLLFLTHFIWLISFIISSYVNWKQHPNMTLENCLLKCKMYIKTFAAF